MRFERLLLYTFGLFLRITQQFGIRLNNRFSENVQRQFTKRIPSLCSLPHTQRFIKLKLDSSEIRRLFNDLTEYYKIISTENYPIDKNRFLMYKSPASTRSKLEYLQKPQKSSACLLSTFFYRQVDVWNSLPVSLRSCTTISSFKSGIRKAGLHKFLEGSALK